MSDSPSPLLARLGFVVTRVLVPLWILTGALVKLIERSPKLLPENLLLLAERLGLGFDVLLAVLISIELAAVAAIWSLPRLARAVAASMLTAFCIVLVSLMAAGLEHCPCLGSLSPPPWLMLVIDGALLVTVLTLPLPRRAPSTRSFRRGLLATAGCAALSLLVAIAWIGSARTAPDGGPPHVLVDARDWAGRDFLELEIARHVDWPADLDVGPRYVVFYSKSCDHCRDLLESHFDGQRAVPAVLVAIPEERTGFAPERWLDVHFCEDCVEQRELPPGTEWIVAPPLVVAIEDGEVLCATEAVDPLDPSCLILG
ncbi:MAG: hypothetical protein AAF533_11640 [Acidobacteriota bacterium]